ncbi:hypothetical protein HMPREF9370_0069 [Neisseria wadsworthii 9715]|uniref:Uncharacterized protein n=1 Tax=Neisseria wadsworthii 9715 TaxID=1030841 RepID=G4CLW0_9NEIS|nr:hypothetical protein HMPREF9370_0069 [Neisseria wadsworthii 9715]
MSVFPLFKIALHGRAATYFLCFAKESKQRKATAVTGLLRKLPSLRMLFGAAASRYAPRAALLSRKSCSVRRRQRAGNNSQDLLMASALDFLNRFTILNKQCLSEKAFRQALYVVPTNRKTV